MLSHFQWLWWGGGGGGLGLKDKVAQNGLKHILVLDFLSSDEIFEILCELIITSKQGSTPRTVLTYKHHIDLISRSALEAARLKITCHNKFKHNETNQI